MPCTAGGEGKGGQDEKQGKRKQSEQEQMGYLLAEEHGGRPKAFAHDKPTRAAGARWRAQKEGISSTTMHTQTHTLPKGE